MVVIQAAAITTRNCQSPKLLVLLKSYSAANFTETLLDCCQKRGTSKETGGATEEVAGVAGYTTELLLEVRLLTSQKLDYCQGRMRELKATKETAVTRMTYISAERLLQQHTKVLPPSYV